MKSLWITTAFFTVACGDNLDGAKVDAGPDVDAMAADAAIDTPIDAPPGFTVDLVYAPPLSANGPDQIQSVAAVPGGNGWYVAGFKAETPTGDKHIFVAKMSATGPSMNFGTMGVLELAAITPTGNTDEIDLALQSDGKILVSFNIANTGDSTDRDVAVARITTAGVLDTTFGDQGIARINFSTKSGTIIDNARGLTVDANNNIFVHAVAVSPLGGTPATSDFALAKLTANGVLCDGANGTTGWGRNNSGFHFIDTAINGTSHNATVRGVVALADGSVIAGGYVGNTGLATGNVALYYKLDSNGDLVTTFGGAGTGIFFDAVLTRQTEVYQFALSADGMYATTGGYGNVLGVDRNDWIAMKINTTTGQRVMDFGGTTNGAKLIDVSPSLMGSNCHNVVTLPGGKTLMVGATGAGNTPDQDAAFLVLDADGNVDAGYGINRFKFAPTDDKNDVFWGAAVNGNKVLVAGWRGVATTNNPQTDTLNDNSFIVIFTLQP